MMELHVSAAAERIWSCAAFRIRGVADQGSDPQRWAAWVDARYVSALAMLASSAGRARTPSSNSRSSAQKSLAIVPPENRGQFSVNGWI